MLFIKNLSIFKNKNFTLLFFGIFVSNLGSVIYSFALGWYILEKTGSPLKMGGIVTIPYLINIFFSPLFGALSDKLNRLKILYITDFIRGFLMLGTIPIIVLTSELKIQIILFYIVTLIETFTGLLFRNASFPLRKNIIEKTNINKANALFSLQDTTSKIMGFLLSGILYQFLGLTTIFLLNGLSYFLSAISEMFIKIKSDITISEKNKRQKFINNLIEGFMYILRKGHLVAVICSSIFINIGINMFLQIAIPFIYNQSFHLTPKELSYARSSQIIGAFIISFFLVSKDKNDSIYLNLRRSIFYIFILSIGFFITYYVYDELLISRFVFNVLMVGLFLFLGASIALFNIPLNSFFHTYVPSQILGRVYSIFNTLSQLLTPFAILYAGYIVEHKEVNIIIIAFMITMLIAYLIFLSQKNRFILSVEENSNLNIN